MAAVPAPEADPADLGPLLALVKKLMAAAARLVYGCVYVGRSVGLLPLHKVLAAVFGLAGLLSVKIQDVKAAGSLPGCYAYSGARVIRPKAPDALRVAAGLVLPAVF